VASANRLSKRKARSCIARNSAPGKFSRTLELPVDIDPEKISAQCKDGIMQITLAKAEHAKPKKIEIRLS
jgi:Molecular chaperone (small heat shock protein)